MTPEGQLKRDVLSVLARLEAAGRCKVVPLEAGGKAPSQRGHGARKGTPDVLVLVRDGRCIWLELKAPKTGRTSEAQADWHGAALNLGHAVHVVRSVQEAIDLVTKAGPA